MLFLHGEKDASVPAAFGAGGPAGHPALPVRGALHRSARVVQHALRRGESKHRRVPPGVSRPLALKASSQACNFCLENFVAGVEMYGGLGDTVSPGLHETSHYLAPVVAWNLPSNWTLRLSPTFGLNDDSHQFMLRWGVSREFSGFGHMVSRLFGGRE